LNNFKIVSKMFLTGTNNSKRQKVTIMGIIFWGIVIGAVFALLVEKE